MKLNEEQQKFIKRHSKMLKSIFEPRVEDLKEEIINGDREEREINVRFVKEFQNWMRIFDLIEKRENKEKKNKDFV